MQTKFKITIWTALICLNSLSLANALFTVSAENNWLILGISLVFCWCISQLLAAFHEDDKNRQ